MNIIWDGRRDTGNKQLGLEDDTSAIRRNRGNAGDGYRLMIAI